MTAYTSLTPDLTRARERQYRTLVGHLVQAHQIAEALKDHHDGTHERCLPCDQRDFIFAISNVAAMYGQLFGNCLPGWSADELS